MAHTSSEATLRTPPIQRFIDRTFVDLREVAKAERAARHVWTGIYPGVVHLNLMREMLR